MNRLSAIDAFSPAFARVRALLFQRFQLGIWIRFGFIGLLGGGLVLANTGIGGSFPGGGGAPRLPQGEAPDIGRILHSIHLSRFFPLLAFLFITFAVLALVFTYLFCRFRFILFDSVITGQPIIARGWDKYSAQANRFFGVWLLFRLVGWVVMFFLIGLPLWNAYKNGVFDGEGSLPAFFALLTTIGLAAIAVSIIFGVISTMLKDFVMPVMALDDSTFGGAWSSVMRVVSSEPGAWAGYMGFKLLCAFGAGLSVGFGVLIAIVPTLLVTGIPAGIVIAVGAAIIKSGAMGVGIFVCCLGALIIAAGFICMVMILAAPVSVFFASYAFYFFGGRYPKLAALLWPQPTPPMPQGVPPAVQPAL